MDDKSLKTMVKLTICGPTTDAHASALGRGVVALLELVQETGSLNKAAKEMGMAYSKAWRIVKGTEEALGVQFMERKGPKGSVLTPDGERLVKVYRTAEKRIRQESDRILAEVLKEI